MMKFVNDIITISEKEILLALRFKLGFFFDHMIGPLIRLIPFLFIYGGIFFVLGTNQNIGVVSSSNYIVFLLIGMLLDVYFSVGTSSFTNKFMAEKYWHTIEALLLAPINKITLIFGVGISDAMAIFPSFVIFTIISYLLIPIGAYQIIAIILILSLLFMLSLSIGLVFGSIALFQESFVPLTGYARMAIIFFSCFYYPINLMPGFLREIALLNPIYHGTNILRELWINGAVPQTEIVFGTIPINPLLYFLFFAIISAPMAVFIFNKLWKRLGVQGY